MHCASKDDNQYVQTFRYACIQGTIGFLMLSLYQSSGIVYPIYFCEPSCLFYLSFNFDFYVSKIMHL